MTYSRVYRFIGGPKDGMVAAWPDGVAFGFNVNLQTVPGAAPIIGFAEYEPGTIRGEDGAYAAFYVRTTVADPVPDKKKGAK